jgi:predicted nucleic acid-binding protein
VTYLWDTTTCSALMRRDARVRARVAALTAADRVVICTITRGEVLYGLARLPEGKRRRALEAEAMALFGQVVCLAVPEAAADQYAAIKRETERQGTPLDENDLWIAATARALEAVVVTTDSDFQRVSGLQMEDWTQ